MAPNQTADFFLGGKPFMLARDENSRGRAWQRTGRSDAPGRRSAVDNRYGELPDEIDHPEVWDDWSGGYGESYRDPDHPNQIIAGYNMDCRFPNQMVHCQAARLLGPEGYPTLGEKSDGFLPTPWGAALNGSVPGPGMLLVGAGYVGQVFPGSGGVAQSTSFADCSGFYIKSQGVAFGSYAYLPAVAQGSYARDPIFFEGPGGGAAVIPQISARAMTVAGNRLWKAAAIPLASGGSGQPRTGAIFLQSCAAGADPSVTANWSATLSLGDGAYGALVMRAMGDQVFAAGPVGLYAGDQSGTFFNVLSEMERQPNKNTGMDMCVHNGAMIVPAAGGIYAYHPGDNPWVEDVSPPRGGKGNYVRGQVQAVHSFGRWLYAGITDGSGYSYLLAGHRPRTNDPYVWNVLNGPVEVTRFRHIHVDGMNRAYSGSDLVGQPVPSRIWIATDPSVDAGGTCPVYYWPIPAGDDNPLNSETDGFVPNYETNAQVKLPFVDWGAPSTPKVFRSVEVWADNMLSGVHYGGVYYQIDNSGTYVLLGIAQESPRSTLYFPSGQGSHVTGQSISLAISSVTASQNVTPVYRAIVLRGALRPKSVDTITAVVRTADGVRDRRGKPMRSASSMLSELRAYAQSATPTTLIDLSGAASQVAVLAPIEEKEVYQQGQENPEVVATVRMAVLSFS